MKKRKAKKKSTRCAGGCGRAAIDQMVAMLPPLNPGRPQFEQVGVLPITTSIVLCAHCEPPPLPQFFAPAMRVGINMDLAKHQRRPADFDNGTWIRVSLAHGERH